MTTWKDDPAFILETLPREVIEEKIEGEWVEFPLGIFLLSSPTEKEKNNQIYRDVEAYDGLKILIDSKITERLTLQAGTKYTDNMVNILMAAGIQKMNIGESDKVLANDLEYEPGTERLLILNELAEAINFTSFWVDAHGYFTSEKYIAPSDRQVDYEYIDDPDMSVIYQEAENSLDIFDTPNSWVRVYSNPESEEALISRYKNENPESPTSIQNRGREIVDYGTVENIADQEALDDYVKRIAEEASQVYGHLIFDTAIMPFHTNANILRVRYTPLNIDDIFTETKWSFSFVKGGSMKHEVRRLVKI